MSWLHWLVLIAVAVVAGTLGELLCLQRMPGRSVGCILVAFCGALGSDLVVKWLVEQNVLWPAFYTRLAIVMESAIGAGCAVALFTRIRWDYRTLPR